MRNHNPVVIEEFNGLWKRGDVETTPPDHFSDCNNIQFIQGGFKTRYGLTPYLPYLNSLRVYSFIQESGSSLLILDNLGQIFDSGSLTPHVPILTVIGMIDFAYVSIGGRAYLSPHDGVKGLEDEFIYVYEGDGTPARKAAGVIPLDSDGTMAAVNSATAGFIEPGVHIFAVIYETDTGFLSGISPQKAELTAPGLFKADLTLPVSPHAYVTKTHVVATKAIDPALYNHDKEGYQFFRVPGATVNNGITTITVSFFDAELLEDVTHLQDLFEALPACVNLCTYHNRMICVNSHDDISLLRISFPGEPEAISEIDGLIIIPLDGNPLTNAQEFRDVLYAFKMIRTYAIVDNGDVPSSWTITVLDEGIGCPIHGMSTVLDSGGVNIDYLLIANYSGVLLFNGNYNKPELSWKIRDLWIQIFKEFYNKVQIINDSLNSLIYVILPGNQLLVGEYTNGLEPKNIKWTIWTLNIPVSSILLFEINKLIIASCPVPPDTLVTPTNVNIYKSFLLTMVPGFEFDGTPSLRVDYSQQLYYNLKQRTVWYRFVAPRSAIAISVHARGNANFNVETTIWQDPQYLPTRVLPNTSNNKTVQFLVEPEKIYYIECVPKFISGDYTNAPLDITIQRIHNLDAAIGSFLITDEHVGYPAVIAPGVQNLPLQFRPGLPVGNANAVLDDGRMCLQDIENNGVAIYDEDLNFIKSINFAGEYISSNYVDRFYISKSNPPTVLVIDRDGNAIKNWPVTRDMIYGIAPSADEQTLFAIVKFDLLGATATLVKYDLAGNETVIQNGTVEHDFIRDILVLKDGKLIVGSYPYNPLTPHVGKIDIFSPAGVFLNTIALGVGIAYLTSRLFHALDNPDSFWYKNYFVSGDIVWSNIARFTTTLQTAPTLEFGLFDYGVFIGNATIAYGTSRNGLPLVIRKMIPAIPTPDPPIDELTTYGLNGIYTILEGRTSDLMYKDITSLQAAILVDTKIPNPFIELYTIGDS